MALRTTRIDGLARRIPCSLRLAALLAGASFSLNVSPAEASDPKAIARGEGAAPLVRGDEPAAEMKLNRVTESLPTPPADFAGQDGVLALFDGRVVAGKVTLAPGGYLLKRPGSTEEMIPTFLVQTASDSLTGCYENLRDSIRIPRPDDHLKLADWCVRQRLLHEAKTEVLAALELDPNRREARDLLMKLEQATSPKPRHRESESAPARSADGFLEAGHRTTEGLGPELTSQFVKQIQPLLVSKCGNAACHGGDASGEFRLANIRRTSASGRTTTLENMRQVLSLIDSPDPSGTRLLSALSSPSHADVFHGPAGNIQTATIRAWVQGAAADKGLKGEPVQLASGAAVWTPEAIAVASGTSEAAVGDKHPTRKADAAGRPQTSGKLQRAQTPPVLRKLPDDSGLADTILKQERIDPFDPEEFNRLVHSRVGGAAVGRQNVAEETPEYPRQSDP